MGRFVGGVVLPLCSGMRAGEGILGMALDDRALDVWPTRTKGEDEEGPLPVTF